MKATKSETLLERRLEMMNFIRAKVDVRVEELVDEFKVSGVTIRNDLTYLEEQGMLKRTFGGATVLERTVPTNEHTQPSAITAEQTTTMAKQIAELIQDGETIYVTHGNLIRKIAPFLATKSGLTIVTDDLIAAALFSEFTNAEIILPSGQYRSYATPLVVSSDAYDICEKIDRVLLELSLIHI